MTATDTNQFNVSVQALIDYARIRHGHSVAYDAVRVYLADVTTVPALGTVSCTRTQSSSLASIRAFI
jgi:hypothetical protein